MKIEKRDDKMLANDKNEKTQTVHDKKIMGN